MRTDLRTFSAYISMAEKQTMHTFLLFGCRNDYDEYDGDDNDNGDWDDDDNPNHANMLILLLSERQMEKRAV